VAYAEAALPANRTSVVRRDSAFSGLASAVYLGDTESPDSLLTATTPNLPLRSPRSSEHVAFGDSSLLLVMSPTTELGGRLMALLAWLVGGIGLLATLGVGALTERLLRRRDQAEQLARDNARLYANQRSVAETLQHSLLPERLPDVPGVDLAFRYQPGALGVDIGGDWYDVIPLGDDRLMIVVGDVSGRGVKAGAVMASLRFAIRAFASQGDEPSVILAKLTRLVDLDQDGHFATVLCVIVDVTGRTITVANAGHPHALLAQGDDVSRVEGPVGVPIGVMGSAVYESVTVSVPPRATLLAFTDGLFERRGETIDVGLERLRAAIAGKERPLEALLTEVVEAQASDADQDDVAILGVRWKH
jgi:serine phosphatase RsbU (regulator of sigma subunit)